MARDPSLQGHPAVPTLSSRHPESEFTGLGSELCPEAGTGMAGGCRGGSGASARPKHGRGAVCGPSGPPQTGPEGAHG